MRLWHIDLIPYLPKGQLVAQKRECDLIWRDYSNDRQTNHILINYIWNYDIDYFMSYYCGVIHELVKRGYRCKDNSPRMDFTLERQYKEHNSEYLTICYYNLREKYLRGQKDFTNDVWERLDKFYKNKIKGE